MNMTEEADTVGVRVLVTTSKGQEKGTYVRDGEILLDSGKKVSGKSHHWTATPEQDVAPPIDIAVSNTVRLFYDEVHYLVPSSYLLAPGDRIRIYELQALGWNRRKHLAGAFIQGEFRYWVLISEIDLPVYDMA